MLTKTQSAWNKIVLLSILDGAAKSSKSPVDNFAIQKLSFLTELNGRKNNLKSAYYKFFRFKYGPFSSGLANDVRQLESLFLIDPESRDVTDRGRFLLDYVRPEIESSETAIQSLALVDKVITGWGWLRGWHIVDKVYELVVPVDDLDGKEMRIADIPQNIDILVPERSSGREAMVFSEDMLADIEAELAIPVNQLDPDCPELCARVAAGLEAAFTF